MPLNLTDFEELGGGGSAAVGYNTTLNTQTTGTAATIVGSLKLAAGTYTAPQAEFGCGVPTDTPTLLLKKEDGTVLATLGGSPSGLSWKTASAGFTLTTETIVDLVLYGSAPTSVTFIRGIKI